MNPINQASVLRFGGLASGIDTESMIKSMMRVERMRLDKLEQTRTRTEWKRDAYRDVQRLLKGFQETRFDLLRPSTHMLTSQAYNAYKAAVSNTSLITAVPSGSVQPGIHTIDRVEKLATAATLSSASGISKALEGQTDISAGATLLNKTLTINLDGQERTIQFGEDYTTGAGIASAVQDKLDSAFGVGRITATSVSQGEQEFLTLTASTSTIKVTGGSALESLGFTNGQSNRLNLDAPMEQALKFSINEVEFSFHQGVSLRQILSEVNQKSPDVRISYSALTDQMTLTANTTGSGQNIRIVNTVGNLFGEHSILNIDKAFADNGTNAVFYANGNETAIVRNTNTFTMDGMAITLQQTFESAEKVSIDVSRDVGSVVERIKGFVEQYNDVISQIQDKLSQEVHRNYMPLTAEQKGALSDKEAELWEEKARSGLLRGDRMLEGVLMDMRRALMEPVEGLSIRFSDLGITTGNYQERGRLHLDEHVLTEAVEKFGSQVESLLAGQPELRYSPNLSGEERQQRYKTSGLLQRISDILQDTIRTTRDNNGRKGILLEKAGIPGDLTEYKNLMNEDINRINRQMDTLLGSLQRKEQGYWKQFTAMEKAMQQMNSQSDWLAQQSLSYQR